MEIQRRPLPDSLRYLAEKLIEVGSRLDGEEFATVGGIAITLCSLADELEVKERH